MIPRDEVDKLMKKTVQEDMFKIVGILPNNNNNVFKNIYNSNL
jgi:superfamily II DNA/RNA helicase